MTCSTTACSRCSASTSAMSLGAVGDQAEVPPVGPQLGLGAEQAGAPDDQPAAAVDGLGDLRLAVVGVVDALPGVLVDRLDGGADGLDHPHADRVLPARLLQALEDLGVPEPRVGPQQLDAGRAGALDARDQLLAEAQDPLLRVRRPLAQADVQRLARVRPGGEDRVVAQQLRVAVGGALLQAAADLADEAVDIDHQPPVAGAGAGLPRPLERLAEQRVELAHVPERERAQERPQRRRRRQPAAQQPAACARRAARRVSSMLSAPSTIANSSAITLRPALAAPGRSRRSRTRLPASASIPSRSRERRDQHHPGVRDDPLVVETDPHAVQSDRLVILHHEGDLLSQAPAAAISRKSPAQEVILRSGPDGTGLPPRWIGA